MGTLRDGFEDYEYLWLLAERAQQVAEELGAPAELFRPEQRSDELARKLVRTMVDYARGPGELCCKQPDQAPVEQTPEGAAS